MVFGRRRTFGSRRSVFRQEIFRLPRTAHPKARLRPGPDRFDQLTCPRNWARTADIGQVARRSYSYWGQVTNFVWPRGQVKSHVEKTRMANGTGQMERLDGPRIDQLTCPRGFSLGDIAWGQVAYLARG
jgi:hypothetical protein